MSGNSDRSEKPALAGFLLPAIYGWSGLIRQM